MRGFSIISLTTCPCFMVISMFGDLALTLCLSNIVLRLGLGVSVWRVFNFWCKRFVALAPVRLTSFQQPGCVIGTSVVGERNQAFVLGPIFTICLQLLRCIFQKWCQECSARLLLQCFFPQTSAGRRGSYLVCTETGLPVRISGRRGCQELLSPAANSLSVRISSRECCLELLIELPSPAANSLPYIYIYRVA